LLEASAVMQSPTVDCYTPTREAPRSTETQVNCSVKQNACLSVNYTGCSMCLAIIFSTQVYTTNHAVEHFLGAFAKFGMYQSTRRHIQNTSIIITTVDNLKSRNIINYWYNERIRQHTLCLYFHIYCERIITLTTDVKTFIYKIQYFTLQMAIVNHTTVVFLNQ
jgi:hypothetical protein